MRLRSTLCIVTWSLLTLGSEFLHTAELAPMFEDQFEGRQVLGDRYRTGKGHSKGWDIFDSVLIGEQVRDEHGAMMRWQMEFADLDFDFDFEYDGGKRLHAVIDDALTFPMEGTKSASRGWGYIS